MIKVFEMFAGYGGACWGLKLAKIPFECVGYSEIDKHAIKIYERNFPGHKNYGDCRNIVAADLPDFDLLTGGFPCQDVSLAGNRDLSNGRTNLYLEILRIANVKRPKFMLLENVAGLLSMNKEDNKVCDPLINKIVRDLSKIGYDVIYKVLNSRDYGVPQNRERVWLLCKLGQWNFMEYDWPNKSVERKFLIDLLDLKVDMKYFLSMTKVNKMFSGTRFGDHIFDCVPEVSPTLCHIGVSDVAVIRDMRFSQEYRRLTPRECFRLMGFLNDEIDLTGLSDNQCYELAGNGWDVHLASLLFKNWNFGVEGEK